jgi:hypothetical protein
LRKLRAASSAEPLLTISSEMSSTKKASGKTQRSAIADVVAREYTIHLHKRVR